MKSNPKSSARDRLRAAPTHENAQHHARRRARNALQHIYCGAGAGAGAAVQYLGGHTRHFLLVPSPHRPMSTPMSVDGSDETPTSFRSAALARRELDQMMGPM